MRQRRDDDGAQLIVAGAVGAEAVAVVAGRVYYIPPGTTHEVVDTGTGALRYVYVVAPAR